MIYIDFEGKTPANTPENPDFPSWKPWSREACDDWLDKSKEYLQIITDLNTKGNISERNAFIDSKSAHWGKLKLWLEVLSHGRLVG